MRQLSNRSTDTVILVHAFHYTITSAALRLIFIFNVVCFSRNTVFYQDWLIYNISGAFFFLVVWSRFHGNASEARCIGEKGIAFSRMFTHPGLAPSAVVFSHAGLVIIVIFCSSWRKFSSAFLLVRSCRPALGVGAVRCVLLCSIPMPPSAQSLLVADV